MESQTEVAKNLLCMACLCVENTVHELKSINKLEYYFDCLRGIPVTFCDMPKSVTICWECDAMLRNAVSFREQVKASYKILQTYTSENPQEYQLTDVTRPPRLKVIVDRPIDVVPCADSEWMRSLSEDDVCVKDELKTEDCDSATMSQTEQIASLQSSNEYNLAINSDMVSAIKNEHGVSAAVAPPTHHTQDSDENVSDISRDVNDYELKELRIVCVKLDHDMKLKHNIEKSRKRRYDQREGDDHDRNPVRTATIRPVPPVVLMPKKRSGSSVLKQRAGVRRRQQVHHRIPVAASEIVAPFNDCDSSDDDKPLYSSAEGARDDQEHHDDDFLYSSRNSVNRLRHAVISVQENLMDRLQENVVEEFGDEILEFIADDMNVGVNEGTQGPGHGCTEYNWSDDFSSFTGQKETYRREPGPTTSASSPVDLFLEIWDEHIMNLIARETNRYALQYIKYFNEPDLCTKIPKYLDNWEELTVPVLYRYIGVLCLMSFCVRSNIREYWETGSLEMQIFRRIMSRDQFVLITKFLHFVNDNESSTHGNAGKICKIAPILDHCNRKFSELYIPEQQTDSDKDLVQLVQCSVVYREVLDGISYMCKSVNDCERQVSASEMDD